jgi:hypothetical protein
MSSDIISNRESIAAALNDAVNKVNHFVDRLDESSFGRAPEGKWNAGQQLNHLLRSIQPLNLAYRLPQFTLKVMFGTSNRPSRTYDGLVEKYESKLALGAKASGRFIPKAIPYLEKVQLINAYEKQKQKLIKRVSIYDEKALDQYVLPHPLLGKLTLREMLFFTIHHNTHHLNLIRKYSKAN